MLTDFRARNCIPTRGSTTTASDFTIQTSSGVSRAPIEEEGGLNLYGFVENNPVSLVDYLGLWTTRAHEQIIDDWLKNRFPQKVRCGCCTIDLRQLLKNASARRDGFTGVRGFHWFPNLNPFSSHSLFRQQSVGASAQHAMSAPGQDPGDAEEAFNDFVSDRTNTADEALSGSGDDCKKLKKAIAALGSAVHAAADNHSPQHSGFQVWHGLGNNAPWGVSRTQQWGGAEYLE